MNAHVSRTRRDRCPGVLRPWIADDGALVRLRLVGGRTTRAQLAALAGLAAEYGDGTVRLTSRANLQIRGLGHDDSGVAPEFVRAVTELGLLPVPGHELVRNIMVSPLSGHSGGRADVWPVADEIDSGLVGETGFAELPGRFLFCLDDGRGDLIGRTTDLGLVALDGHRAQLRIGSEGWGPVVDLDAAAVVLLDLARGFLSVRGDGPDACWHVDELPGRGAELCELRDRHPLTRVSGPPPPYGTIEQDAPRGRRRGPVRHIPVTDGVLTSDDVAGLPDGPVVVTPWRGVLTIEPEERAS